MKTPWKDGLPFPLETIGVRIADDSVELKALRHVLPKLEVVLTSGNLSVSLRLDQIFEPLVSVNTAWDRKPLP